MAGFLFPSSLVTPINGGTVDNIRTFFDPAGFFDFTAREFRTTLSFSFSKSLHTKVFLLASLAEFFWNTSAVGLLCSDARNIVTK